MGGIGITELLLVLVIALVFFGGGRLRNLGSEGVCAISAPIWERRFGVFATR